MIAGPLSPFAYFVRNKRRALPVVAVIALAVFAVSLTAVLTGSMIASARAAWVEPFGFYSLVAGPKGLLEPRVVRALKADGDVSRLMPVVTARTRVVGIFGSDLRPVFGLKARDLEEFLRRTGLRLVDGRLPRPGKAEVALHGDVLKGKEGARLGGEVGQEVDPSDPLPGKFRVVGVLAGPIPVGVAPYDSLKANSPLAGRDGEAAYLVFPRPWRQADVDAALARLPEDEATVKTYPLEKEQFDREIHSLDLVIWVLNLVTIAVMALATGLLNVIFFLQRMGEFGILAAMGYSRGFLVARTFLEVLWTTLVGWLVGLGVSRWALGLVSRYIYEPKGIPLTGIDARVLSFTLPIPLLIACFSLGVVAWQLWRLDAVSIVERRE